MTWHSRWRPAAWSIFRGRSARRSGKLPQVAGVERYLEDVDAARGQLQRVLDRLGERRAHGNGTRFAYPLDASSLYGEGVTWWRISILGTSTAVGSR
jgi:hypothetical protein